MPRIPSNRVATPRPPRSGTRGGRGILKSHLVSVAHGEMLVGDSNPGTAAPTPPQFVPGAPTPSAESGDAVRDALASAERGFERRLEAAVAQAREAGFQEGLAQSQASANAELERHREHLDLAAGGFKKAWDKFAPATEPLLAEFAFRLAEAILGAQLPDEIRRISTTALSDALEQIGETGAMQVTLNPVDFMMLTESGIVAQLGQNHPKVAWHTDASFERGDWEARSDASVVRRVAMEMLTDVRERLSHTDSAEASLH